MRILVRQNFYIRMSLILNNRPLESPQHATWIKLEVASRRQKHQAHGGGGTSARTLLIISIIYLLGRQEEDELDRCSYHAKSA
jgi:hypothetical protein